MGVGKKCINCHLKDAGYGFVKITGDTKEKGPRLYCHECRDKIAPDAISLRGTMCDNGACLKSASQGHSRTGGKKYCLECALMIDPSMHNVVSKMCSKCGKYQSNYNVLGQPALFCKKCATEGMIDVKARKCKTCLVKNATYGLLNGKQEYCATCAPKDLGYFEINKIHCEKCDKLANFNLPTESKPRFCNDCKEPNMVNLFKAFCKWPGGCDVSPSYGKTAESPREFCANHGREANYVKVNTGQLCIICKKVGSSYGMKGDEKPTYCATCALPDMINIKAPRCKSCDTIATWNLPNTFPPVCCVKHAEKDMIDVTAVRCSECTTTASFGFPGEKQNKCAEHKKSGMISTPRKRCTEPKCKQFAVFGVSQQTHCEEHKQEGQYNITERTCKSCKLLGILNEDELCGYCTPGMIKGHRLAKQKDVKLMLDKYKFKYISYDKVIDTACGKERPDFVFDCGTHHIVLEIDEYAHKISNYNPNCENARMGNISQMLGRTIFVRFNPDGFKVNGVRQNIQLSERYVFLRRVLSSLLKRQMSENIFMGVYYLFFDEFDSKDLKITNMWSIGEAMPAF